MKNLYFMIILVSMAALLVTGCGDKTAVPDPDTAPPVTPEVKSPEVKSPEPEAPKADTPPPKTPKAETPKAVEKKIEVLKAAKELKVAKEIEAVEEKKAAKELEAVEEKEAVVIALEQKRELAKENAEIAVEQEADKSVEAPKGSTNIVFASPPEEPEAVVNEMELVYFDYDKSVVSPAFREVILNNYEWIAENPDVQIQLEGHCDERGTNEYNLALGERRAKAVFDLLLSLGANPSQYTLVSFGEERPTVPGSNEFSWGKNRRVEFTRL